MSTSDPYLSERKQERYSGRTGFWRGAGMRLGLLTPWQLCWLGMAIRLVVMTALGYFHVKPQEDHYQFGWEMGRIARSLATGHGYGNPFHDLTGPTAWVTPLYPLILGGVFKIFGVYSALSAWVILAFGCILNALMIPMIWATGTRIFSPRVGQWSGWLWALYPAAMQYAVKWFWEMTLTCFLFEAALLLALIMRSIGSMPGDGPTWPRWLGFGALWGLIGLSNPGVLLFLPVCGIWILAAKGRNWFRDFPKALAAGVVFLAFIAPWSCRNYVAFHTFVPMRTNFGAELYLGNGPGATGFLMEYNHPNLSLTQFRLYQRMGEVAYTQWRGAKAKALIRQDLPRFLRICLTRVYFFWASIPNPSGKPGSDIGRGLNYCFASITGVLGLALALRQRRPAAGLLAFAFLLLPLVYYIVSAHARFRHPLEPVILILSVFLFQQAELRWGWSAFGSKDLLGKSIRSR